MLLSRPCQHLFSIKILITNEIEKVDCHISASILSFCNYESLYINLLCSHISLQSLTQATVFEKPADYHTSKVALKNF